MRRILIIIGICLLIPFQTILAQTNEATFNYLNLTDAGKSNIANSGTLIDESSTLYEEIAREFHLTYESIGQREALRVLAGNNLSITGGLNSIGFSYKKPFVSFGVSVDRNLAPDLFDAKRWIVTDTFVIEIDASKILGELKKDELIDLSQENLAAFAGVVFKRKYTWVHFAASYEEGLMRHFDKLFLPYRSFNYKFLSTMNTNEMLFREDSLSMRAGGIVSAPLYTGINAMGGVLAKYDKLSKTEAISLGNNKLQVNSEKEKSVSLGVNFQIQADFLKILKMTLLSYDLSYELVSSYKIYLEFNQNELAELTEQNAVVGQIKKVLKNKEGNLEILAPYIISEEKKITQAIEHKYSFLLLGGHKESRTQQIEITKNDKVKTFFKHYYEKIKYTDDALSKLFSSFIFALTNSDVSATKLASHTHKVTLEYDSVKNLVDNQESINISDGDENNQKLSLKFSSEFRTQKTSGILGKKYRDRAVFILERYSGVNPIAVPMIESEQLKAPFYIKGNYEVNLTGIRYLNQQSVGDLFGHFDGLCDEYPKTGLINFRNLFDRCRRSLQNDYVDYLKDLSHDRISGDEISSCQRKSLKYFFSPGKKRAFLKNCLANINKLPDGEWVQVPLWPLKNLSTNIANNCYSKVHYFNLFGLSNVFFHGSFTANTAEGFDFSTSFHEGKFKGLGAVDHYMRSENLRAPASVVVD